MAVPVMSGMAAADDLERLRGPVVAYCYRMLGSSHAAEDAVQETMLRAWRSRSGLQARDGLRPWVFKIATNVCIDALNDRRRRALPMDLGGPSDPRDHLGMRLPESAWVEPLPTGRRPGGVDPVEHAVERESIRLAFVAALQHLAPRQRAVLILRDVLRWRAAEVAELLDTSVTAVNSALRRARAALAGGRARAASAPSPDELPDPRLVELYVDAFQRFDVEAIVALLHRDVVVSMPPYPFWLRGREAFRVWLESTASACGHAHMVVTEANGCPAVALYDRGAGGELEPSAIHVLEGRDDRIGALHAFLDPAVFPMFGL
jgi:RNA polymerase sigma-70 factor, ECF subfamily